MLLIFRYRYATLFASIIGVFLFTCNANRDIVSILSRVGLSISYSAVLGILNVLAADADFHLRAWGAATEKNSPAFLLLFDNINKMQRAWQVTLGHRDQVQSGTAATLIRLEDIPSGAMDAEPFLKNLKEKKRKDLTTDQMMNDIDWDHITGVGEGTLLRVWSRNCIIRCPISIVFAKTSVRGISCTEASVNGIRKERSRNWVPDVAC